MIARGGVAWRWAPLLAAVAVAVAWRGGYTDDARGVVAALAGLAALAAVAVAPEAAGRAARHPIVLTLVALAVVTALTAAWTIGAPSTPRATRPPSSRSARSWSPPRRLPAPWGHAGILLFAALATAVAGLAATIATSEPLALNLCGSWRPAGPFEYPPALALVCASALPVALCAATERRRALAIPGALAAWLLVMTVALTANRTAVGLSALAVIACVALAPRARAVGPVALAVIVAATASALILHGDLARAGDGARILALLPASIVVAVALWSGGARPAGWRRAPWTAAVAVAGILATTGVVLGDRGSPCGGEPSHGRVGIWRAALHTAAERPVQGFGAGTFLAATHERQLEERPVPTRFAHDLALQEWVEVGLGGLLAVLAWYLAVATTLVREIAPPRSTAPPGCSRPAVAAFPLANLLDWPWALAGAGALWAVALGGLLAGARRRTSVLPPPEGEDRRSAFPLRSGCSAARALRCRALPFLHLGDQGQFWLPGATVLVAAAIYARASGTRLAAVDAEPERRGAAEQHHRGEADPGRRDRGRSSSAGGELPGTVLTCVAPGHTTQDSARGAARPGAARGTLPSVML